MGLESIIVQSVSNLCLTSYDGHTLIIMKMPEKNTAKGKQLRPKQNGLLVGWLVNFILLHTYQNRQTSAFSPEVNLALNERRIDIL